MRRQDDILNCWRILFTAKLILSMIYSEPIVWPEVGLQWQLDCGKTPDLQPNL